MARQGSPRAAKDAFAKGGVCSGKAAALRFLKIRPRSVGEL
jgi:hypothetical protein